MRAILGSGPGFGFSWASGQGLSVSVFASHFLRVTMSFINVSSFSPDIFFLHLQVIVVTWRWIPGGANWCLIYFRVRSLPASHGAGRLGFLYQSWVLCSFSTHEPEITLNPFWESDVRAGYPKRVPGFLSTYPQGFQPPVGQGSAQGKLQLLMLTRLRNSLLWKILRLLPRAVHPLLQTPSWHRP